MVKLIMATISATRRKPQRGMTLTPKLGPGLGFGLGVVAFYFLMPLVSAFEFSARGAGNVYSLEAYGRIASQYGFKDVILLTTRLVFVTVFLTILIMVPTVTWVHLKAKKLRRLIEFISLLPLVIPPVVLVLGVLATMPNYLKGTPMLLALEYVMLAMPYTFRALDAGLGAIDVRTLVDAARGLGSPWHTVFMRIIAPNIRSAIFGSIFLNCGTCAWGIYNGLAYVVGNIPNLDRHSWSIRSNIGGCTFYLQFGVCMGIATCSLCCRTSSERP